MNTARRKEYLAALGIERWTRRAPSGRAVPATAEQGTAPAAAVAIRAEQAAASLLGPSVGVSVPRVGIPAEHAPREAAFDWPVLEQRVAACTRCALSATRTRTVFGVGARHAQWLVVGEAPGFEEDRQGEPFVGRAGQLLNLMLRAVGLAREQVYIANVLKCRPPQNRDPQADEARECLPYLERQIALLKPRIMLVVGRIAAQNLLRTDAALGSLRQKIHAFGAERVPLVVTYHPAYLLRTPIDKRKAWDDLRFAREVSRRG